MTSLHFNHGPDHNVLGNRERATHGRTDLPAVEARIASQTAVTGYELTTDQAVFEAEFVARERQAARAGVAFVRINSAAPRRTGIVMRNALPALALSDIEVRLSDVYPRKDRRQSRGCRSIAAGCNGGHSTYGDELALSAASRHLSGEP